MKDEEDPPESNRRGFRPRPVVIDSKPKTAPAQKTMASSSQANAPNVKKTRGRPRKDQQPTAKVTEGLAADDGAQSKKAWPYEELRERYVKLKKTRDDLYEDMQTCQKNNDTLREKERKDLEESFQSFVDELTKSNEQLTEKNNEMKKNLLAAGDPMARNSDQIVNQDKPGLHLNNGSNGCIAKESLSVRLNLGGQSKDGATEVAEERRPADLEAVEEVDLLTPEGSPRPNVSSGVNGRESHEEQPSRRLVDVTAQTGSLPPQTSPPQESAPLLIISKEMGVTTASRPVLSCGVSMCPEATNDPGRRATLPTTATTGTLDDWLTQNEGGQFVAKTPTRATPEKINEFETPPKGKKRPMSEPASDFKYTVSVSSAKTKSKSFILRNAPPPCLSEEEAERCLTSSQMKSVPNLDFLGFKKKIVSKTEVMYEHTILPDKFALLCENFGANSKKEIEYVPLTISGWMETLPDYLKRGTIKFARDMLDTLVSIFIKAAEAQGPNDNTKKPALQKSI